MTDIAKQLDRDRRAVESQIRKVFRGVTRHGGVSWSESFILDGDGSDRTREEARALDKELRWEDLIDDPNWLEDPGLGGLNFLDPIGYRYYLAPVMIRCMRNDGGESISHSLIVDSDFQEEQVSLLNAHQKHVVAQFVRLMITTHTARNDTIYQEPWSHAYRVFWKQHDRGNMLE